LQNFLDLPKASTTPAGPAGATQGGAAGDFLQNRPPQASQLPADRAQPGQGQDARTDNRGDRQDTRTDNRGDRQDTRTDNRGDRQDTRTDNRQDRQDNLSDNRADRIDNVDQRKVDRQERRNEVRDQFRDNHPRADFWKSHPHAARWRWTRPYRWATWAAVTNWFPWGWSQPASYSYGDTVYYEGDTVHYGDNQTATADEYAQQAEAIAAGAPEPGDDAQWMSLGVFALTQDGPSSGPPPTMFMQLAVSKEGVIAGTFENTDTNQTQQIEGAVDQKTQRTAWAPAGKDRPIVETGISNLTEDEAPVLVHFADGQTQQWLMIRLDEPEGAEAQ
jgi:hypothetical protein